MILDIGFHINIITHMDMYIYNSGYNRAINECHRRTTERSPGVELGVY